MEKKLKKRLTVAIAIVFALVVFFAALSLSVVYAENSWTNWYATYAKADIEDIVKKENKTEEDYALLYRQTGLTKLGVDGLCELGLYERILKIQSFYFKKQKVSCNSFIPYTYLETLDGPSGYLCALEDGDIILSATTHSFFMRVGHAVLVVDAAKNEVVESLCPGVNSELVDASTMTGLANYMVIRPTGIPVEIRKKAAECVKNQMVDLPYDLTIGIFSKKFSENPKATQCAHLAWYGYKKYGYDIDGNGGLIVKPQDIFQSEYFEVVQIFGFDPNKLWY